MNKDRWARAQEIVREVICKHLNPFTSTPAMAKAVVEALAKIKMFEEPGSMPVAQPPRMHTLVAKLFDNGDGRLIVGDVQVAEVVPRPPREDARDTAENVYNSVMGNRRRFGNDHALQDWAREIAPALPEPDPTAAKGNGVVMLANTLQQYGEVVDWKISQAHGGVMNFSGVVRRREDAPKATPAQITAPPGWVCPRCKNKGEFLKAANAHESEGMVPCRCVDLYPPRQAQLSRVPFGG